jgi:hemolysin III
MATAFIVGVSIFSTTTGLLYPSSAIYHALPAGKAKRIARPRSFFDLSAYRRKCTLGVLRGAWGWTLFGVT